MHFEKYYLAHNYDKKLVRDKRFSVFCIVSFKIDPVLIQPKNLITELIYKFAVISPNKQVEDNKKLTFHEVLEEFY